MNDILIYYWIDGARSVSEIVAAEGWPIVSRFDGRTRVAKAARRRAGWLLFEEVFTTRAGAVIGLLEKLRREENYASNVYQRALDERMRCEREMER